MENLHYNPVILEPISDIEKRIHQAESTLGIRTKFDRLLEASLFVDKHFFDFALITGQIDTVERVFGHEEWVGYLEGRQFARNYGRKPLTVDFILGLHAAIAQSTRPEIGGKFHPPGGRMEFPNIDEPPLFTDDQLRGLDRNPLLSFKRTNGVSLPTRGYIKLPFMTDAQMFDHLQTVSEWYNQKSTQKVHDSHHLAASLQQRLVSGHC